MTETSAVNLQLPSSGRVHVVGAGPVGLMLTALLQGSGRFSVHLYEKRREYTRTRMVRLAPYLVADSVESYSADHIDGETVEAVFDPAELERMFAFRRTIPDDLMSLLREWTQGFCPLNSIEHALSELIDARPPGVVERTSTVVSMDDATAMLEQGDVLIDCTGSASLLRDRLLPDADMNGHSNTLNIRLEYALVVTFLYGQSYECNEFCKYFKNVDNVSYKFIPAVHRTYYDGAVSHVTGIVNISEEDYQAMPSRFDGEWLREHFPAVAESMDRFIDQVRLETSGELLGDLEIVRIPLNLYRARNATNRRWLTAGSGEDPLARSPVFLLGDSAIGSPYFQSISLGYENAMVLAGMLATPNLPLRDALDAYELHAYKQWLRVYMRSKMIKHNKDLFEHVDDKWALLERLHIY
jgi:2-polyprenyl-6-methoxyphenol hydroxylase-like FAD-dependent oxidoreductase